MLFVIVMVIIGVMVLRTNPEWYNNHVESGSMTIEESQNLELIVMGTEREGLQSQPVFNTWEIADELWGQPRFISPDMTFSNGTMTFNKPGIYEVNTSLPLGISNYSLRDINPILMTRLVRGTITHRYDYSLEEFVSNVGESLYIPHERTGIVTLINSSVINITQESITDGRNSIMIQYMVQLNPEDLSKLGEAQGIRIQRNMNTMLSSIYITNLR